MTRVRSARQVSAPRVRRQGDSAATSKDDPRAPSLALVAVVARLAPRRRVSRFAGIALQLALHDDEAPKRVTRTGAVMGMDPDPDPSGFDCDMKAF